MMDEVSQVVSFSTETIVDRANRSKSDIHMYSVSDLVSFTLPELQDDVTDAT